MQNIPLLVLESLNRTTFRFSRNNLACCVKKRLAPSTTYLKWGLPSVSTRAATLEMLTASGLMFTVSTYIANPITRCYSPTTTRNEDIRLESKVRTVPEIRPIGYDFSSYQNGSSVSATQVPAMQGPPTRKFHILVFNTNQVSILAELGLIEVAHRYTQLGQTNEFFTIDPRRVREDATAVDDGNCLVGAQQDLIWREGQVPYYCGIP